MKICYYPGCTLKTRAKNLDRSVTASLEALGVEVTELPRWNCCGAAYSLADDNLLALLAPVRNLVRAKEMQADTLATVCSMCYNTLARANQVMAAEGEKRDTINRFMTEEPDYFGEVRVTHILNAIKEHVGFDRLKDKVVAPLDGLKVAPYYGCLLTRPRDIAIDAEPQPRIFEDFLRALGAEVVPFDHAQDCCGAYQVVSHPDVATKTCAKIIGSAVSRQADILVTSCPLCEHNLGVKQKDVVAQNPDFKTLPTAYFSQLLAVALGLDSATCHFELNKTGVRELLEGRQLVKA